MIIFVVACIVVSIILVRVFGSRKNKSMKELFPDAKLTDPIMPTTPEPTHRHGIETGCFPPLPRAIDSEYHHVIVKKKVKETERCTNCSDLEKELAEEGYRVLKCLESNQECVYPDFTKYNTDCKLCKMILEGWERYFIVLKDLDDYIQSGKMPTPPEPVKTTCKGCKMVESKKREFAEAILRETMQIINNEPVKTANIPSENIKKHAKCDDCENVFKTWAMYIFALIDIGNYARCMRNKALNANLNDMTQRINVRKTSEA
jgi:hypothetical protein